MIKRLANKKKSLANKKNDALAEGGKEKKIVRSKFFRYLIEWIVLSNHIMSIDKVQKFEMNTLSI